MTKPKVPRWLIDATSAENRIFVVHTQPPRFVAELQAPESAPDNGEFLEIDGWVAVPVEWFPTDERTSFSHKEMASSLNAAWKRFDREND